MLIEYHAKALALNNAYAHEREMLYGKISW